jgi:hypothetical protein
MDRHEPSLFIELHLPIRCDPERSYCPDMTRSFILPDGGAGLLFKPSTFAIITLVMGETRVLAAFRTWITKILVPDARVRPA